MVSYLPPEPLTWTILAIMAKHFLTLLGERLVTLLRCAWEGIKVVSLPSHRHHSH